MRVALFTKKNKPTIDKAVEYLKKNFKNLVIHQGERKDEFPKDVLKDPPDLLISYLSPWIIPDNVLKRTKMWNINFHPGPPEYPGIGCFNFAMYNREKLYGVTAHLMRRKVDTGKIIGVRRFPLLKSDSIYRLSIRSYDEMLLLFFEVMDSILTKNTLPDCDEVWKRKPYTRKELEKLCRITPNMGKDEIKKRIKATIYPNMPGAYVDISGYKFEYNADR